MIALQTVSLMPVHKLHVTGTCKYNPTKSLCYWLSFIIWTIKAAINRLFRSFKGQFFVQICQVNSYKKP